MYYISHDSEQFTQSLSRKFSDEDVPFKIEKK